jgi:hypothetical protein
MEFAKVRIQLGRSADEDVMAKTSTSPVAALRLQQFGISLFQPRPFAGGAVHDDMVQAEITIRRQIQPRMRFLRLGLGNPLPRRGETSSCRKHLLR